MVLSREANPHARQRVGVKRGPAAGSGWGCWIVGVPWKWRFVEPVKLAGVSAVSTDPLGIGGKQAAEAMVAESHANLPTSTKQVQCDFLDVPTPEEMARSRKELRTSSGENDFDELDVLDHARAKRKASAGGRKPNSKNKRTKDFERYILQNGNRDPALILAEIASTAPEVLVQRSAVMDPAKKQLTYGAAQALRTRAAEGLMPYMHGKKPVQVELRADGDFNLIIPGVNTSHADAEAAAAGQFVLGAPVEDGEFTEVDGMDGDE